MVAVAHADATTWRVEQDGSGQFTTIAAAAAACAEGDTILLGPGHYTEYTTSSTSGTELDYYVWLEVDNVTLRGVDRDLVTIGPDQPSGFDSQAIGFVNTVVGGTIVVEQVTFAHCIHGITTNERSVTVRYSRFIENGNALNSTASESVLVEGCEFLDNEVGVLQFEASSTPELIVRDCEFRENTYGIDSQEENNLVENCFFSNSSAGAIQFTFRGIGVIRSCTFEDNNVGIYLNSNSIAHLQDNHIWGGAGNLALSNGSYATGSGNVFAGGSIATIYFVGQATASMSGNHILLGSGTQRVWVRSSSGSGHIIDLRNNYWGTTSAAEIAESIQDSMDEHDPVITGTVLYEPFLGVPVAAQHTSFGQLRAIFGQRD